MAFDIGFDFRGSTGYVTDPAYAVFQGYNHVYPYTYTNANGYSINAGWPSVEIGSWDNNSAHDPRLAGWDYRNAASGPFTFQIDLGSGSAPGAATYDIDLAIATGTSDITTLLVKDNTTTLIDLTNGGTGVSGGAGAWIDATGTSVAATTTWTGTTVSKTFATTTALVTLATAANGSYSTISHFRLALAGPTIIEADFTAAGAATVTGVSGAIAGSVLTAAGIAAMTGAGAAVWLGTLVAAGAATVTGVSGAIAGSAFTSAGVATVAGQGEDSAAPAPSGMSDMMIRHHHHGL